MKEYEGQEVLYENDAYRVYRAQGGVPCSVGREVIYMDGYVILNKMTEQQDGEARSYANAVVTAHEWDTLLARVSHVESGVMIPKPNIQN